MAERLFFVDDSGSAHQLELSPFAKEDDLQALLANNPEILGVIDEEPRKFLLVRREMSVPDAEGPRGRWSVDHLFLHTEGVPTLVETKRSSDTRLRREMVGQMLDYAANGLTYWPTGTIGEMFEARCEQEDSDADEVISRFAGRTAGGRDSDRQ